MTLASSLGFLPLFLGKVSGCSLSAFLVSSITSGYVRIADFLGLPVNRLWWPGQQCCLVWLGQQVLFSLADFSALTSVLAFSFLCLFLVSLTADPGGLEFLMDLIKFTLDQTSRKNFRFCLQ